MGEEEKKEEGGEETDKVYGHWKEELVKKSWKLFLGEGVLDSSGTVGVTGKMSIMKSLTQTSDM